MKLKLLDRWSPPGLLLESEAEIEMSRILESGPGTDTRAIFAQSLDWRDALKAVASDTNVLVRSNLVVFPQTKVVQYRTDFLVVCANVAPVMKRSALSRFAFFIECDGLIGHAENAQQFIADHKREQIIRDQTGMAVLRFSGAEVMYQRREVHSVIAAQVQAMAALRDFGDAVRLEAQAILDTVSTLAAHRAIRSDFTARNSARSQLEPYDPSDPLGDWGFSPEIIQGASWDMFLKLRLDVARLNHTVARARSLTPETQDTEFVGELQPFQEAFFSALEAVVENWKNPQSSKIC